jgi:Putative Flp pilus-assembly TadE/G-like
MAAPLLHRDSERGAILIWVAISILVLTAFLVFVLDYGVLWVSRGQAQNSADAGALAGAIARAYDDLANPPSLSPPGKAAQSALSAAQANKVWSAVPGVQVSWTCPPGVTASCVRVDVYRNGQFGSTPLPMLFGQVLNITQQGVRATATAISGFGNSTNCMRPFAIADKWIENTGTPDQYNHWIKVSGKPVELDPRDQYPGATYTLDDDLGTRFVIKGGNNPQSETDPIEPGWMLPIQLPDGAGGYVSGAQDFRDAIAHCIGNPVTIGDWIPTETGVMNGPTNQGVDELIAQDPNAIFNDATDTIEGSCAPACAPISPRIIPITVFDMEDFQHRRVTNDWSVCPIGGKCVKVVNILGFFVEGMSGGDVIGYFMTYPGEFVLGAPNPGAGGGFLVTIQLVR